MHIEDHRLFSLNYHHRSASKFWVMVAPSSAAHLEACLATYAGEVLGPQHEVPQCSQFVRHMSVWVGLEALNKWGVAYELAEQRPGDLVITAPGTYHQKWNAGANLNEAINYADDAVVERLAGYRCCSKSCNPSAEPDSEPIRLTWPASLSRGPFQSEYIRPLSMPKDLGVWKPRNTLRKRIIQRLRFWKKSIQDGDLESDESLVINRLLAHANPVKSSDCRKNPSVRFFPITPPSPLPVILRPLPPLTEGMVDN
jgi:hypothetical protein